MTLAAPLQVNVWLGIFVSTLIFTCQMQERACLLSALDTGPFHIEIGSVVIEGHA